MKLPTSEDVAGAKALAAKNGFCSAVVLVELDAIDEAFIAAPFDRVSYAAYVDALHRDAVTAHAGVFAARVLWPALPEALKIRDRWPAVAGEFVMELLRDAGDVTEPARVTRIDDESTFELPKWMSRARAAALLREHKGETLWIIDLPSQELAAVLRTPLPDTWLAARSADTSARIAGKNVIGSLERWILEAEVPAAPMPLAAQLERRPALFTDLRRAYLQMGGEGGKRRSKRL